MGLGNKLKRPFGSSRAPESSSKLIGPSVWSEGTNPVVDIVFVHGLTGDGNRTWTAPTAEKPWPQTLLAEDIPNARLITYGYDADIVCWTRPAGQNTIREHATNLINDLCTVRNRSPRATGRPIIFVAHSLGGLVCQDAIFLCNTTNNPSRSDVLASVRGVIFFGTPHAGSDLTVYASALASIIEWSLVKKPNKKLLKVLDRNSEILANIEDGFFTLVRNKSKTESTAIDLFVFYEEKPLAIIERPVVKPESAKIKGYDFGSIYADHMGMTKFSARDNQYNRVLGILKGYVERIETSLGIGVTLLTKPSETVEELPINPSPSEPNDPLLGTEKYFKYPPSPTFHVERPKLRQTLAKTLATREQNRSRIVVLEGLGGQGKTQLAIEYCYHSYLTNSYHAIFWLDASSESALQTSLISLTDTLKPPDRIFENDNARMCYVLEKFRSWNRNWLLVLDNFDRPKDFPSLERHYVPHSINGSVLITSRHRNLHELGAVLPVPPMDQEEALKLLLLVSGLGANDIKSTRCQKKALSIVRRLGYLPLAIHQAGAFIRRRSLRLSEFLGNYEARKKIIWAEKPAIWNYNGTVYTTWELSFDSIDDNIENRSRKGAVLTMLAFLDFRKISNEIFQIPRDLGASDAPPRINTPSWLRLLLDHSGNWDIPRIDGLIRDFHDLSLLSATQLSRQGTWAISLHPLVAEWIRHRVGVTAELKLECLLQAFNLVKICLRALRDGTASRWVSSEMQDEIMKHEAACHKARGELAQQEPKLASKIGGAAQMLPELVLPPKDIERDSSSSQSLKSLGPAPTHTPQVADDTMDATHILAHIARDVRDDRNRQVRSNILSWLSAIEMQVTHHSISERRLEGTCSWIFKHNQYLRWIDDDFDLLYCAGPPGSGKTMLASRVIDRLEDYAVSNPASKIAVSFFYCSFHSQHGAAELIRALVRQLVALQESPPGWITSSYNNRGETGLRITLSDALNMLCKFSEIYARMFIVIDALDECRHEEQGQVLKALDRLIKKSGIFKILVTSRPNSISRHIETQNSIQISDEDTQPDMERIVTSYLSTNSRLRRNLDVHLKTDVTKAILQKSQGSFIWARLALESLGNTKTTGQQLYALPPNLTEIYARMMRKIGTSEEHQSSVAYRSLSWILLARRPLTIRELSSAMSHKYGYTMSTMSVQHQLNLYDERSILDACQGLAVVDFETKSVRLVHSSVADYLVNDASIEPWVNTLKGASADITETCLSFMDAASRIEEGSLSDRKFRFPLLSYAASFWVYHALDDERPEIIARHLENHVFLKFWGDILLHEGVKTIMTSKGEVMCDEILGSGLSRAEIAKMLGLQKTGEIFLSLEKDINQGHL